jgi:hypothetical protein
MRVCYRVDSTGERIAILPATCKLGTHSLSAVGFRAVAYKGEVHVSCAACAIDPMRTAGGWSKCWVVALLEKTRPTKIPRGMWPHRRGRRLIGSASKTVYKGAVNVDQGKQSDNGMPSTPADLHRGDQY